MIEVWLDGADKPIMRAKRPEMVVLIDGDSIAIRARGAVIEIDATDINRLVKLAERKGVI